MANKSPRRGWGTRGCSQERGARSVLHAVINLSPALALRALSLPSPCPCPVNELFLITAIRRFKKQFSFCLMRSSFNQPHKERGGKKADILFTFENISVCGTARSGFVSSVVVTTQTHTHTHTHTHASLRRVAG